MTWEVIVRFDDICGVVDHHKHFFLSIAHSQTYMFDNACIPILYNVHTIWQPIKQQPTYKVMIYRKNVKAQYMLFMSTKD